MKTSEQIDKLAEALSKAQGAMVHPNRNRTAVVPLKTGGKYEYTYADMSGVLDAIRKPFADNGLCIVQAPATVEGGIKLVSRIVHSSGQWIEADLTLLSQDDRPQSIASVITYARRYTASALAGIFSEEDDDGNAANGHEAETKTRAPRKSPATTQPPAAPPTNNQPSTNREQAVKMLKAFLDIGVTRNMIEEKMGCSVDQFTDADFELTRSAYLDIVEQRLTKDEVFPQPFK